MYAEEVARGIKEREANDPDQEGGQKVSYRVADPSIFLQDGGPSRAERMVREGIFFKPADNRRVAREGHAGGWDQMRGRMVGLDEKPMIYTFSTCVDSIRTIPALQHDEKNPEDVDTESEDHAADEWRYACMSRPWIRPKPKAQEPIVGMEGLTLERLFKENEKRRRRA